jgi:hypothetical protein
MEPTPAQCRLMQISVIFLQRTPWVWRPAGIRRNWIDGLILKSALFIGMFVQKAAI